MGESQLFWRTIMSERNESAKAQRADKGSKRGLIGAEISGRVTDGQSKGETEKRGNELVGRRCCTKQYP